MKITIFVKYAPNQLMKLTNHLLLNQVLHITHLQMGSCNRQNRKPAIIAEEINMLMYSANKNKPNFMMNTLYGIHQLNSVLHLKVNQTVHG